MPKVIYTAAKGLFQEAGSNVELNGNILQGDVAKVYEHTVTSGNTVLTAADSGCFVTISGNALGQTMTFPDAADAPGWHCTLMATDTIANIMDSTADSASEFVTINIVGSSNSDGLTGNSQLRITTNLVAGDIAEMYSDGTQYIVNSQSTTAGVFVAV
jgi:hypothetical protein